MSSAALGHWTQERILRIRQLTDAHAMVGGPAPGRRTTTQAINWALVVILCSELQGYFRELHDESADFLAQRVARGRFAYFSLVRNGFTENRQLDRVNAKPESIQSDFNRLGIDLWTEIEARVPSGRHWRLQLSRLNQARNAIAHNNPATLAALAGQGYPLTLQTVNSWRAACVGVTRNADKVVSDRLYQTTGMRPW
ncbi:hypothetical protein [Mycobacterium paraffinicum]|uniref:hypothetical protein n=1 Tax=Mycobacterium paraffinicum TaxID=53378 RepID=UPI0021F3C5B4|nr:hypothetical protein [Mycobacterium paraffinicum]MCV7311906.1 hypothetical protein [Mycobacterium paraffinicum]